jgi:hypothetical protein
MQFELVVSKVSLTKNRAAFSIVVGNVLAISVGVQTEANRVACPHTVDFDGLDYGFGFTGFVDDDWGCLSLRKT